MPRLQTMTFGEGLIGAIASAVIGWMVSSVTKVSRRDFEKAVSRLEAIEKDVTSRMTRADFDKEFGEVKTLVRDFRLEMRTEFRELRTDLKTKP